MIRLREFMLIIAECLFLGGGGGGSDIRMWDVDKGEKGEK